MTSYNLIIIFFFLSSVFSFSITNNNNQRHCSSLVKTNANLLVTTPTTTALSLSSRNGRNRRGRSNSSSRPKRNNNNNNNYGGNSNYGDNSIINEESTNEDYSVVDDDVDDTSDKSSNTIMNDDYYDDDFYNDNDDDDDDDDGGDYTSLQLSTNHKNSEEESLAQVEKSYFFSQKDLLDPSFQLNSNNRKLFTKLCDSVKMSQPSRIQALAWPTILKGTHTLIADQTGSGKTLAYLFPLIQRALTSTDTTTKNGTPRILVLAPTSELSDQIYSVCEQIRREGLPELRTMILTANGGSEASTSIRDQIRQIEQKPITVLVSTPGRIATILRSKNNPLNLGELQSMVLDEVDVLMAEHQGDESKDFGVQLRTIAAAAPQDLTKLQFVFATATLPERIAQTVEHEFGKIGLQQIRGPGLHRISPTLEQQLVDVSVNEGKRNGFSLKLDELKRVLRERKCRRTLIFCNTVESCRDVENALTRHTKSSDIIIGAYHNAMTPLSRNYNLRTFTSSSATAFNYGKNKKHAEKVAAADHILICTDRASRGVDFDGANVDHVVVFDFPKDPAEYVRRVGRTARAGRNGYATIMAYGWQLPIARTLMKSNTSSSNSTTKKRKRDSLLQQDQYQFDDNDNDEYSGGAQARAKRKNNTQQRRQQKDDQNLIKGNIEGGTLWSKK